MRGFVGIWAESPLYRYCEHTSGPNASCFHYMRYRASRTSCMILLVLLIVSCTPERSVPLAMTGWKAVVSRLSVVHLTRRWLRS